MVDKVGNKVAVAVVDVVVGANIDQHVGRIEDIRDGNYSSNFDAGCKEYNGRWMRIAAGKPELADDCEERSKGVVGNRGGSEYCSERC